MPIWKILTGLTLAASLLSAVHQSIAAAPRIAPIASGPYLLGGSENGKWIDPATTAKQLRGDERYRIYTTAGQIGTATGTVSPAVAICLDTYVFEFKPEPKAAEFVAFGGATNPLPRKPRLHSPSTAVYRQLVADLLRAKGITKPDVRITKIVRIDLEGDGVDEVLLSAARINSITPYNAAAGDYSFVVLRKIINGKVQTIPIAENYYPKASNYAPVSYTIPAIADFNGDGKLEIMVKEQHFEGSGAALYTVQGNKVTKVLSSGCGV